MEKIKAALQHLGFKGMAEVKKAGFMRYQVFINSKYIGIFDLEKNTFVD